MDVMDRIIISVNVTKKQIMKCETGVIDQLSAANILLMQAAYFVGGLQVAKTEEKKIEQPPKGLIVPRHIAEERQNA